MKRDLLREHSRDLSALTLAVMAGLSFGWLFVAGVRGLTRQT